jgi:hypothetical protein
MRKFLIHENLDQYIDFHIYSDEINCSKPNPLIFQEVKNNLKIRIFHCIRFYISETILLQIIKEQKISVSVHIYLNTNINMNKRYSLHHIHSADEFTFSPAEYSYFKYGDKSYAEKFAKELFEGFISEHEELLIQIKKL